MSGATPQMPSILQIWSFLICHALLVLFSHGQDSDRWIVQDQRSTIEIYAEFEPDLKVIWSNLYEVEQELARSLQMRRTEAKVQIMLFSSHSSYLRYLGVQIPEAKHRRAIFYRNGDVSQVYAFRSRSLITDLRHELTHVLLHQNLQFLPLWIDEGLAEYLEESAAVRHQSSRLTAVKWKARFGWNPSLRQLEAIPSAAAMTEDDYRDSWAWIYFQMNHSEQSRSVLSDYLRTIAKGEAPGPFSGYLAARSVDPKKISLNSYFRKNQISVSFAKDQ